MTETFRAVEPLRTGEMFVYVNQRRTWVSFSDDLVDMTLTVAQVRALRDWLDLALPCEHKNVFQECFGSDYRRKICRDCGATLP